MKAIIYSKYGGPEVLRLHETDRPAPKEGEVLVKVHAVSVNSWDWDLLTGKPYLYRLMFGFPKPKYPILGSDVAGTVEDIGDKVTKFKVGDEVFGDLSTCWGGFAEYVCAPEKMLLAKPGFMGFDEASAVPQAGVLAMQSLLDKRAVAKGEKILINGAGGGVGTFAVQMAKYLGAEVTAVDSKEKLDMLLSIGADHVIDYKKEDFSKNGQRYHRIIDVMAKRSIYTYKRSLLPGGIFFMVGGSMSAIFQAALLGPLISLFSSKKLGVLVHQANKNIAYITGLIESGKIKVVIDKAYSLNEAPKALRYLGKGLAHGKLVVKIQPDPLLTAKKQTPKT